MIRFYRIASVTLNTYNAYIFDDLNDCSELFTVLFLRGKSKMKCAM